MEAMRESWTDDRLDDLREDVNRGFTQLREDMTREIGQLREGMTRELVRVDADIRELRVEVKALRSEMNELRSEVNGRFDSLQRTLMAIGGGVLASVAATVLAAVFG